MAPTRFVILHHRQRDGEHWDFMIEQADALATWRLEREPLACDGETIPAERIADHRKAYLEYEGPVSRDRGEVSRIESGGCEILSNAGGVWRLRLDGGRLRGHYEISESAGVFVRVDG